MGISRCDDTWEMKVASYEILEMADGLASGETRVGWDDGIWDDVRTPSQCWRRNLCQAARRRIHCRLGRLTLQSMLGC